MSFKMHMEFCYVFDIDPKFIWLVYPYFQGSAFTGIGQLHVLLKFI